jgi:hypothetical protein
LALTTITVTGTYDNEGATAASGTVTFTLSAPLVDTAAHVTYEPIPYTATLSAGAFSINLPATNDSTTSPTGLVYNVVESITGVVGTYTWSAPLPHTTSPLTIDAWRATATNLTLVPPATSAVTLPAGTTYTSQQGLAGSVVALDSSGLIPTSDLGTGVASSAVFLRGDRTWSAATGGTGTVTSVGAGTGVTIGGTSAAPTVSVNYGTSAGTAIQGNQTLGGDVTGTIGSTALAPVGPGATGPIGSTTVTPVITIDAKGRVTALTSATIATSVKEIDVAIPGVLVVVNGTARWYNTTGATITISKVSISVGTAPTGASIIADVFNGANSLWAVANTNRPTIAASAYQGQTTTFDNGTYYQVASGGYLTIGVKQIGSTVAGSDLLMQIRYS